MTPQDAIDAIAALAQPGKANEMNAYHKVDRPYLGVANPDVNDLTQAWRDTIDVAEWPALADALWQSNIFEARLAAAKLLTRARIKDDGAIWALISSWRHDFDSWAIADHVAMAGAKRLVAAPERLDEVETWTEDENMWVRRAALIFTLPWAKFSNPKPHELAARERILGWAANYVEDKDWFIQKAVAWWLRDHSKHDAARVVQFLDEHGDYMKPFAIKEASKYLK